MSNVLKPLVWHEQQGRFSTKSPITEYEIVSSGDKYKVYYTKRRDNYTREATGFVTVDDAKAWAWNHYNEKMQPYINEPTLVDAVNTLVDACHGAAVKGGWWHDISTGEPLERNTGELLMLMVSEIAEAMEGDRKGLKDDHLPQFDMLDVEIADTLIRIFDFIGGKRLDSAIALDEKLKYNAKRADHKIENRIKDGGKKY